jgi:hypothetical protein
MVVIVTYARLFSQFGNLSTDLQKYFGKNLKIRESGNLLSYGEGVGAGLGDT